MKKLLCALAAVVCVGLGGFTVWGVLQSDRKPPVITFQNDIRYSDALTEGELLEGVIANDEQDGDVSDSLVIESISTDETSKTAIVFYAARDKSNNVSKAKRILTVADNDTLPDGEDSDEDSQQLEEDAQKTETEQKKESAEKSGSDAVADDASSGAPNTATDRNPVSESSDTHQIGETDMDESDVEESDAEDGGSARMNKNEESEEQPSARQDTDSRETESESETESEELAPGSPVIKLTADKAEIKIGANFVPLNYVASVQDDLDNIYTLWRDIQITGDYDIHKAGTYTLTFYVVDSSGNTSNHAKLKLTVKP